MRDSQENGLIPHYLRGVTSLFPSDAFSAGRVRVPLGPPRSHHFLIHKEGREPYFRQVIGVGLLEVKQPAGIAFRYGFDFIWIGLLFNNGDRLLQRA